MPREELPIETTLGSMLLFPALFYLMSSELSFDILTRPHITLEKDTYMSP